MLQQFLCSLDLTVHLAGEPKAAGHHSGKATSRSEANALAISSPSSLICASFLAQGSTKHTPRQCPDYFFLSNPFTCFTWFISCPTAPPIIRCLCQSQCISNCKSSGELPAVDSPAVPHRSKARSKNSRTTHLSDHANSPGLVIKQVMQVLQTLQAFTSHETLNLSCWPCARFLLLVLH